jgi:antitoxin CptB
VAEDRATRLKRLRLRSWRRGIREMDLILGRYADAHLGRLDPAGLDAYEALLDEADPDLYLWVSNPGRAPERHAAAIGRIAACGTAPPG